MILRHEGRGTSQVSASPLDVTAWKSARAVAPLASGQLHLWRADVEAFRGFSDRLATLLSEDERRRANNFRFPDVRERFAIGRGLLRCILSQYTAIRPQQLVFDLGPSGKPALAVRGSTGPVEITGLHFNLAHTDNLLLILVGRGQSVGIDVEMVRPVSGLETLLGLLFEAEHCDHVRLLPPGKQAITVLTAWTLKEALGKAAGGGLVGALSWSRLWVDPVSGSISPVQRCCEGNRCYCAHSLRLDQAGPSHQSYVGALALQVAHECCHDTWDVTGYTLAPSDLLALGSLGLG